MDWNIKKQVKIYDLLLCAMYSDNTDYIEEQLNKIFRIICLNNIGCVPKKEIIKIKKGVK